MNDTDDTSRTDTATSSRSSAGPDARMEGIRPSEDEAALSGARPHSCVCGGLGAYVDWKGPRLSPAHELRACPDHPLGSDDNEIIRCENAAAMRIKECLNAMADVRDIPWPGGDPEASWSPDTAEALGRRLAFLAPRGDK